MINIWNWTHQEPKFTFYTEAISEGSFDFAHKYRILILSGAIYNDGSKPLFPIAFNLNAKYDSFDNEIIFKSVAIPNDSILNQMKGLKMNFNTSSDLMRVTRINPSDANYGILLFVFETNNLTSFPAVQNMEQLEMTCLDIVGRKRTIKIDLDRLMKTTDARYTFPKSGTIKY